MRLKLLLIGTFLLWGATSASAQRRKQPPTFPEATAGEARLHTHEALKGSGDQLAGIAFESVGPTVMSGRVVDVDVNPQNPSEFLVAYASGGLWHTTNNGTSFAPIFDQEAVMTIGDIACDWSSGSIWIGTGENNSSRSSYSGTGMYRGNLNGERWEHLGLTESHHIGRIVLHPEDPDTVWVAVLGHLYSPNAARGVYRTVDGGQSWNQVLFVHPNAGAVDVVINPTDPMELFAATWERKRRAWDFEEGGAGTGIHHSTDGGLTWKNISADSDAFPQGTDAGRIGLDVQVYNGKRHLVAVVDNQGRRPESPEAEGLTKFAFESMTAEAFEALDNRELESFLRENNFPKSCDSTSVKSDVAAGTFTPQAFFDFLHDPNQDLFDTEVKGTEVYRYDFDSAAWRRTHAEYLDDLTYSYGYYFGQVRLHPKDPNRLYTMGVPLVKSADGGQTWRSISQDNVHADHHALWIDPALDGHLINGNDGGINISYDDGETWIKCNNPAVGQCYTVQVDHASPYNIYSGLQDNGVWKGPSDYEASEGWQQSGHYPYEELIGGDGMHIQVDWRDDRFIYTGYQFGNYFRIDTETGDYHSFQPQHQLGQRPLRWNWQTPIALSPHHADILYMGSNKLHRSMDRGETWTELSDDLTRGGRKGDVPFGTLTSIAESALEFGVLAVGSDDGLVHVSKDGGVSWNKVWDSPQHRWVSRVIWSGHAKGRIYLTLNGYRWDEFWPHVLVSDDYGSTWRPIENGLPAEPVNVIREDPAHPDILYVGTDQGLYVTLDRGELWKPLGTGERGLPRVAVHDMVIQEREMDLVVGTHGRSVYVADIGCLSAWLAEDQPDLLVMDPDPIRHRSNWGSAWNRWLEPNLPEEHLMVYSANRSTLHVSWMTADSLELKTWEISDLASGFNTVPIPLDIPEEAAQAMHENTRSEDSEHPAPEAADNGLFYLEPGTYILRFTDPKNGAALFDKTLVLE